MLRAVLDTNVFFSGIFFSHGTPAKLLDQWRLHRFEIVVSKPIYREIVKTSKKIQRRTRIETKVFESAKSLILKYGSWVEFSPQAKVCRDPKDNSILDTGHFGKADFILSGDKDLLVLKKYKGIPIISPKEFLTFLENLSVKH